MNRASRYFFLLLIISFLPLGLIAQEICDNAVDDDGDGLIDFQDDDCECEFIEIRSLIPNPSFEQRTCCPDQHYRLDCAVSWIQAYGHTPDYIHTCGWMGPGTAQAPTPFPDGEACIGFANGIIAGNMDPWYNWKEYAGACLLNTMKAGVSYRIEFALGFASRLRSPPLELTIYGTEDCINFPFGVGTTQPGCPTNFPEWVRLEGRLIEGGLNGPEWVEDFFEFTPDRDIKAVAIGADCEVFDGQITEYYYLDNLIMEETFKFLFDISVSGDVCNNEVIMSVATRADLEYQWYKDSIALVGETSRELKVTYGNGNYQVRMINPDGCIMSEPYPYFEEGAKETTVIATICQGETYEDGDFMTQKAGNHRYVLETAAGCDSIINLSIEYCDLFVPNVFSPNFDGVNDSFKVFGKTPLDNYTISIFNRWGGLIYRGPEWDGTRNGEPAEPGVYVYMIQLNTVAEEPVVLQGSITLIR